MGNFAKAIIMPNEIVKAADFTFGDEQGINNVIVALSGIIAAPGYDFVIGGIVKPYSQGGMNISISPLFVHSSNAEIDVVEGSVTQPISIETASHLDRIDIIQVSRKENPYDFQDRKFRDPETGTEIIERMATKINYILDVVVKKGIEGSAVAPTTDPGYVKLAEVIVPAGTTIIKGSNIINITARFLDGINVGWTNGQRTVFNPGYLIDIVGKFLISHDENGKLKDKTVLSNMVKFGTESNGVNGSLIPTGLSMAIIGMEHNALSAISQVMKALALAVNSAYPYSNNLLSRYTLLHDSPVATSTENIDIDTGGQQTIDGITCSIGQLVFLKDQTDPKKNGYWQVQKNAWTRYSGYSSGNPSAFNYKFIYSKKGIINRGKVFYIEKDVALVQMNLFSMKVFFLL